MEALRTAKLSADRPAVTAPRSEACLNCGTALTGPFCASCGQRDVPPYPSVRDLVVDAFWELSGWDGRFAATVRALVRRPGMLTREFLEGRRARHISPLRLYLMASLVYFLLAATVPDVTLPSGKTVFVGLRVTPVIGNDTTPSRPERTGQAVTDALNGGTGPAGAAREELLADIASAPAVMRPFLRRAVEDPAGFKRGILQAMPRMLFALLPVFAGIVALFYRGRKYPEHLYFAIHLHAFIFLALAVSAVTKFTGSLWLIGAMGVITLTGIPVYSTLAFRRVYGGSIGRTVMKEVGIATIYGLTSIAAFICMVYWVSLAG